MKRVVFAVFVSIFVATAVVTLLGLAGLLSIPPAYLDKLFYALVLEVVACVVLLFKKFFLDASPDPTALRLRGWWWQFTVGSAARSLVRIDVEAGELVLQGEMYDPDASKPLGNWKSMRTAFRATPPEIIYFWEGVEFALGRSFSGVGAFQFELKKESEEIVRADGWFTRGNLLTEGVTDVPKVAMRRVPNKDVAVAEGRDDAAKLALASAAESPWGAPPKAPRREAPAGG